MNSNGDGPQFKGGIGALLDPTFAFMSEPSTGIYLEDPGSASSFTIAKRGTRAIEIDDNKITVNKPIFIPDFPFFPAVIGIQDGKENDLPFYFEDHATTGMYWDSGESGLGLVSGGATKLTISNSKMRARVPFAEADGTAGAPSYAFNSDLLSGMFLDSNGVHVSNGGTDTFRFSKTLDNISFRPLQVSGLITADSMSCTGSMSCGAMSCSSINSSGTASATTITSTSKYLAPNGAASAPSFSFTSGTDAGLSYNPGTAVNINIGGTTQLGVQSSGIITPNVCNSAGVLTGTVSGTTISASNAFRAATGTSVTPSIGFTSGTNSGLYYSTSGTNGQLNFTTSGSLRATLDNTGWTCPPLSTTSVTATSLNLGSGTISTSGAATVGALVSTSLNTSGGTATVGGLISTSVNIGSGTISTSGAGTFGALSVTSVNSSGTTSGTVVTATGSFRTANGSASVPIHTFSNDSTTGWYYESGSTEASLSTAGTKRLGVNATRASFSVPIILSADSASALVTTNGSKQLITTTAPTSYSPTIGDGSINFTTSSAVGAYYAIGPQIVVYGNITWTGKNGATAGNQLVISMPSATNASYYGTLIPSSWAGLTFTGQLTGFTNVTTTSGYLTVNSTSGGASTVLLVSNCSTSGNLNFCAIYST